MSQTIREKPTHSKSIKSPPDFPGKYCWRKRSVVKSIITQVEEQELGTRTHLTVVSYRQTHTISIYHTDIDTCITFKHTDTYAHEHTYQ